MNQNKKKVHKRRATVEIDEFNKKSQVEIDIDNLLERAMNRDKSDTFDRMRIEDQGRRATLNALNLAKEIKQNAKTNRAPKHNVRKLVTNFDDSIDSFSLPSSSVRRVREHSDPKPK